ncbi:unnamed protein product [Cercospora beticola]|nr:unnamed protein product [Cercospora beticola]
MHFTGLNSCLVTLLAISSHVSATSPRSPRYNLYDSHQVPIGEAYIPVPEASQTVTIHYTVTRTLYDIVFPATATKAPAPVFEPRPFYTALPGHGVVMKGPPLQQNAPSTCDAAVCAVCRWEFGCREGIDACYHCNTQPYCDCP